MEHHLVQAPCHHPSHVLALSELHLHDMLIFWVLPRRYFPLAVMLYNCLWNHFKSNGLKSNCASISPLFFQAALLALAAHASDPNEADRLKYLASPAGKVGISLSNYDICCYWNNHLLTRVFWCRMNMHSGLLPVREASWKSWLSFLLQSLLLEFSSQQ